MYKNYLTIARRNLLRYKMSSIINLAGLSIGITCCMVMLIFVRYESGFDSHHPYTEKTYRVVQHTKFAEETAYWNTTAYPLAEALRNDFHELSIVTQASGPVTRMFSVEDKKGNINRFEDDRVLFVDPYYPKVFDLQWLTGDHQKAFEHPGSVVLTESMVKKCFGDDVSDFSEAIGKTILLNNKDELFVTGVIKDVPGNTSLQYNMLIPYEFFKQNNLYYSSNWSGNYQGTTFIVLNDGVEKSAVEKKIDNWKKKYLKSEDDHRISYFLQPLTAIHNETKYGSSPGGYIMAKPVLRAATGVALFLLVIACVNFINLITAQAVNRSKEVGVRKVLGSSRLKLMEQFIIENAIVILMAILISIGLAQILLDQLNRLVTFVTLQLRFQFTDLLLLALVGIVVVLLAGIYPAFVIARFKPVDVLKNKLTSQRSSGFSLRRLLIVLQFSIVQVFIIATIVVTVQMHYFKEKDLGFDSAAIITVAAPSASDLEAFKQQLNQNAGISGVTFGSGTPIPHYGIFYGTTFRLPTQSEQEGKEAELKVADASYLDVYNIELIAGRNFSENRIPFDEFIVNERVVKAMGWQTDEAIGRKLMINEGEATIVGVVKDFHNTALQEDITPCIFLNWGYFMDVASVRLAMPTHNLRETLSNIEKTWKAFSPEKVYSFSFVDESLSKHYALEQLTLQGFTIFSIVAVFIGCLGLFGLMSFITVRKTKEVGVRKVLGASVTQIVSLFSREFILLITIAFVIGSSFAWYVMGKWLQGFVHHIDLSWWMYASGGVLALLIAFLTVSYQSVKAAFQNPVDLLRDE